MPKNLPDIEYAENSENRSILPFVDSKKSLYQIPFYKDEDYFSNLDSYTKFVKDVEKQVRSSDRYSKYKKFLMDEVKLDHCQVLTNITKDDADIELHHGPIFTLYDYCCIVLEWNLMHKNKITTYRIADEVLTCHEKNMVQLVMLSSTMHEQVHDRNIFISIDQAYGDLNAFIQKYNEAIGPDFREKINRYIDRSMISGSNDYGLLDLDKKIWS
jgi:hypothetical protein